MDEVNSPVPAAAWPPASYCRACGQPLHPQAAACPSCGVATNPASPAVASSTAVVTNTADNSALLAMSQQKSVGLAVFLSFLIPGLGQLYAGRTGKGVAFLVASFFSFLLMFVIIGFLVAPVVWIWAMIDAANSVSKYNLGVMVVAGVGGHHTTVVAAGTASPAPAVFTPPPPAPAPDPGPPGREAEQTVAPLAIETEAADTNQAQALGAQETAGHADRPESPVSPSESISTSQTCPHCGGDVRPGARFCRSCGAELAEPVTEVVVEASGCPHCGTPVAAPAKFCPDCGSAISVGGSPPASLVSSTEEVADTGADGWRAG